MKERSEILLGLSGGIDSEYSAKLLINEGFIVYGLYINMLNKSTSSVEKVADNLGIDLKIINKSITAVKM